jgi:hypothetical protein
MESVVGVNMREKRRAHARMHVAMVRKVRPTEESLTLAARGLDEKPSWMKPKIRNCLWCGESMKSDNAGDRFHPRCRGASNRL